MRRYDLALLDFDGTLADTFPWFQIALNDAAARFGFRSVSADDQEALRASTPRQILARLGLPLWKVPLVSRYMRARMAEDLPRLSLFDGVPRLLATLSASGVRLAIVSSNSEANVRALLRPETARHVEHYECGTSVFGKAPRIKRVLARTRLAPARALLIGDEVRDAEAARASAVAFGAVVWGFSARESLARHEPAETFETVDDILRAFAGSGEERS